jgi:hypothetical protein
MTIKLRTKRPDRILKQIVVALEEYQAAHPRAEIEAYRQNSVSVRVRIIDPDLAGKSRVQREEEIWPLLEKLPEETVQEISLLLLFTPDETAKSLSNMEFDNPTLPKL